MADILKVVVRARDGIRFEGEVTSVSSINTKGQFDVLPSHANFICTIEKKLWWQPVTGPRQELNLENGVLHVANNKVDIYLGIK